MPTSVANAGGRYFGFVHGGTLRPALAAAWMVSAWDQNAALNVTSPGASFFEQLAIEWVIEVLGLPVGSSGSVVTGATAANFVCLCAARHELLKRAGWDAEADGLFGGASGEGSGWRRSAHVAVESAELERVWPESGASRGYG